MHLPSESELVGRSVPNVTFRCVEQGAWVDRTTASLFAGKTVVVFALPGAFTPTCTTAHVPRYAELLPQLREAGVDDVVCISVNDGFVMQAWQQSLGAEQITFIPDGNGSWTRELGLLVDKQELGFGPRSWRYSLLVRDGAIERAFIEPNEPGDPYVVSDADTMLRALDPTFTPGSDIVLLTKPGCNHCARAKATLDARGLRYDTVTAGPRMLRALAGATSTPQVFIDGRCIGGADELEAHI